MLKLMSQLPWFCIVTPRDWLKNLAPRSQLNQSEVKRNPIVTYPRAFSQRRPIFAWSSDWFIEMSASVVIGQNNYFGFGVTTLS